MSCIRWDMIVLVCLQRMPQLKKKLIQKNTQIISFFDFDYMARFLATAEPESDYIILSRTDQREDELAQVFKSVLDTAVADSALLVLDNFYQAFPKMLSLLDTNHTTNIICFSYSLF